MEELDFTKDVKIDETALDFEWLDQPALAYKYGKYWSLCKKRLAQAEERIKVVRAQLVQAANEKPDETLGPGVKPTIPNVEAYYRTHPDHISAKEQWIDAQFEFDMAEIGKNEIVFTRKEALENLVKLHGQNYFAGPSVPRDLMKLRTMANEHESKSIKKSEAGVASKLNWRRTTPHA